MYVSSGDENQSKLDKRNVANGQHKLMENGLLLTSLPPSHSRRPIISCSIFFVPHLQFLQLKTTSHFHHHHHHLRLSFTLSPTRFSKWDSNADRNFNEENHEEEEESFTGNVTNKKKRKKKRKWWSKNPSPRLSKKRPAIIFDEAIESILIFRVNFISYPFIYIYYLFIVCFIEYISLF